MATPRRSTGEHNGQTDPPVRIVIADDHEVVRRGLRALLESEDEFEVVAEADNAESARRYVHGHHPAVLGYFD